MCRYYYANLDETREKVKAMIRHKSSDKKFPEWDDKEFPEMKQSLLKILNIEAPDNEIILLQELLEKYMKNKKQDA
jgi:hypothetical protein